MLQQRKINYITWQLITDSRLKRRALGNEIECVIFTNSEIFIYLNALKKLPLFRLIISHFREKVFPFAYIKYTTFILWKAPASKMTGLLSRKLLEEYA